MADLPQCRRHGSLALGVEVHHVTGVRLERRQRVFLTKRQPREKSYQLPNLAGVDELGELGSVVPTLVSVGPALVSLASLVRRLVPLPGVRSG